MREPIPPSARELRGRYRDAEGNAARLSLLDTACLVLADQGSTADALASILAQAMRFLTVEEGALLFYEAGTLTVRAAQGAVLPVGARLPAAGVLAAVLQAPMQPMIRQDVDSSLRLGRQPRLGLEVLVPLRFGGVASGVLALLSPRALPVPSVDDLRVLQALATVLAAAQASHSRPDTRTASKEAAAQIAALTPREQQVFALLPRGLSNAQMAEQLGIATGTAKVHVERILNKLGLSDRTQAAVRASEWGHRA